MVGMACRMAGMVGMVVWWYGYGGMVVWHTERGYGALWAGMVCLERAWFVHGEYRGVWLWPGRAARA